MSEPRRLLDRDHDHGPAALLLSSARDDAPSAESFDRVALRLGVAGTVLGAAALTGGAATAATTATATSTAASGSTAGAGLAAGSSGATAGAGLAGASAGASAGAGAGGAGIGAGIAGAGAGATVAKVAGVSLFTKLVGVAAVGLAVTGGAAIARHELGSSPARPNVSVESTSVPNGPTPKRIESPTPNTPLANAPVAEPNLDVPAPVLEGTATSSGGPKAAPEALEAPKPSASIKPSSTPESPRETTLRDEVALLDRARAEIARGATGEALATLAKHDATYPRGFLGSEAEVLRIEALVRAGRTGEAKARGEALLAREPNGPHEQRVRTLLGQ